VASRLIIDNQHSLTTPDPSLSRRGVAAKLTNEPGMLMKTKGRWCEAAASRETSGATAGCQPAKSRSKCPLPGERVARDGAFISRRGPGEGLVPFHSGILSLIPLLTVIVLTPLLRGRRGRGGGCRHYDGQPPLPLLSQGGEPCVAHPFRLFCRNISHRDLFPARKKPLTRHAPADESAGA